MFAQDVAELLESIEINSINVVGFSIGGMIAFQLAVNHPNMIKSLVIVNSNIEIPVDSFKIKFQYFIYALQMRFTTMKKIGETRAYELFPKPEQEELRRQRIERFAENDKKAYINSIMAVKGWTVRDRLYKITCPTLIIGSDEDYTPISVKEEFTALIPNAKLVVIKDARHAVAIEKPKEFNEILMSFLSEQK
jgi:3-oxoadipate enol-lactonase